MLRRDVDTILAAHRMDPGRRELYVEGGDEYRFLNVLADLSAWTGGQIWQIEHIDIPNVREGGNRARVLSLARRVEDKGVSIRGWVDADDEWLFPSGLPENVWKTDGRDFESYFLTEYCFTKMGIAAGLDGASSGRLLRTVLVVGRELGALRIVSKRKDLQLPFQKTDVRKSVDASKDVLVLDLHRYVTTLAQNAGRSIKEVSDICATVRDVLTEYRTVPDLIMISGKDAMSLVDIALRAIGSKVTARSLLATFEHPMVRDYKTLSAVVGYLRNVEE